jgi:hypothetical protein
MELSLLRQLKKLKAIFKPEGSLPCSQQSVVSILSQMKTQLQITVFQTYSISLLKF